jgi:hypothetical protein
MLRNGLSKRWCEQQTGLGTLKTYKHVFEEKINVIIFDVERVQRDLYSLLLVEFTYRCTTRTESTSVKLLDVLEN